MPHARALVALLLVLLAAGCGAPQQGAAPSPSPAPATSAPTAPPTPPTATPAPAPTAEPATPPTAPPTTVPTQGLAGPTPEAGGPLPAALYLLDDTTQQIFRLEADGRTRSQVTFEAAPVLEFAVAAEAATIAYVVDDPAGGDRRTLVLLDGGGRRERLYEKISGVAINPDGTQVVYRLDSPAPGLIIGSDESASGVWSSLPYGPGRPSLGTPDVPADGVYDGDAPAWSYTPLGWSPDGSRLALVAYDADGPGIPGGEVAIFPREGREPVRGPTCCEWPAWSADGTAIHSAGGGPGPDVRYGLYRLDTGTGAETPVIEQVPDGPVPLVTAPRQLADGELYAFVELAPADGFSWEYRFRPRLSRVGTGGDVTPLAAPVGAPVAVLWDQDARGAVVAPVGEAGVEPLAWVPADGSAIVALDATGVALAWAAVPVAEGDCSVFTVIGYQQPASRQFSAGARDVQARLAALGFEPGASDGYFGDQTRAAVVAFQRDRGLDASGDVTCATWQALLAGRP